MPRKSRRGKRLSLYARFYRISTAPNPRDAKRLHLLTF